MTRRELLAVVTYVQHFRHYLLGRRFELRTDHGSLTWLQGFKEPEGQLARWLERLQEFDFKIIHRRGKQHGNADALSRRPRQQCGCTHEGGETERVEICSVTQKPQTYDIRELQLEDDVVGPVLTAKIDNQRPTEDQLKGRSHDFRQLIQLWDQLVIKEGVLYRNYEDAHGLGQHLQLIVPKQSREEILRGMHGGALGGHLGEAKTLSRVKERFYWPGHSEDVELWCKNCPDCAARKTPAPKRKAPLQKFECGHPMQIVATDIVGPFPESEQGNTYVLVASDYLPDGSRPTPYQIRKQPQWRTNWSKKCSAGSPSPNSYTPTKGGSSSRSWCRKLAGFFRSTRHVRRPTTPSPTGWSSGSIGRC